MPNEEVPGKKPELTERLEKVRDLYNKYGNKARVAKELGISRSSVRSYLDRIRNKGVELKPEVFDPKNPVGFDTTKTTRHYQTDAEGNVTLKNEWIRSVPGMDNTEMVLNLLENRTPVSEFTCESPNKYDKELMLEWCLADLHHGMRASEEETGQEHNVELSRELVVSTAKDIFSRTDGGVAVTRIVSIGDFFHSDFFNNKTEKSGHSLWTADTYVNIARCGIEAIQTAVEIALMKSDRVELEFLPGNHDHQSSTWLQLLMEVHYAGNDRVSVSKSQELSRFYRWGINFFGYSHGHTTNAQRLAMEVLTRAVQEEPGIKFFYARTGHLHNGNRMLLTTEDHSGVIIERIPTMIPKDKFTADGSYRSQRGTVATVFHKRKGQRYRLDILPQVL